MAQDEGKWHELLQNLRLRLRRGMDGDVSSQQRRSGLEYKVNFGVNILRLKEIAKSLPADQELADLMWSKEVRELRLLSIYIRPISSVSLEGATMLVHEVDTLEVAEQLSFSLLRQLPFAIPLLNSLFSSSIDPCTPVATVRYLLLNHLALDNALTPSLFREFSPHIIRDFTHPDFYSLTTLYNALQRIAYDRPDLPLEDICNAVVANGNAQTKSLAMNLLSIITEDHD